MKLKDLKILKAKSGEELKTMLPELISKHQELKLRGVDASELKYKIALIKTLCKL